MKRTISAASAVISDGAGRVLLIQRGTEPDLGAWSVPGGKLEPGETFETAAAREALEETGLQVAIGEMLWQVEVPAGVDATYRIRDFSATVIGGALHPGDDAADARWVGRDDLDSLRLTAGLQQLLTENGVV